MPKLKVLSSGSQGNAYILDAGGETLLLELGIPFKEILKGLDYDISRVVGCLVSHSHTDHSQAVEQARKYQLRVFTTENLQSRKNYLLGGFKIKPLQVPHGDCKCYAYMITHESFGSILFATDLSAFPYTIKGLNHILIECNYDEDVIVNNAMDNRFSASHSENHLSLNNCIRTIKRLHSRALQNIVLLHLSRSNGDPGLFKLMVHKEIGMKPYVAESGLELELSKEEF